jgi:hypothetical protein
MPALSYTSDVVVAWYNEPGVEKWVSAVASALSERHRPDAEGERYRIFVFHKGEAVDDDAERRLRAALDPLPQQECRSSSVDVIFERLANVGREADTWLHYTEARLRAGDLPAHRVAFLQGSPWDHFRGLHAGSAAFALALAALLAPSAPALASNPEPLFCSLMSESRVARRSLSHPQRLELERAWEAAFGCDCAHVDRYVFAAGAQYLVDAARLSATKRPLAWWTSLLRKLRADEINAWEIERFWMHVFGETI